MSNKNDSQLRRNRDTTNFNDAEKQVAERNRENYGFDRMGPFLRALALGVPFRARITNPSINQETADAMLSAFSCFNQTLKLIHTTPGMAKKMTTTGLVDKYFAFGEQISKCRQELYSKFDKKTVAHYALALLSSSELQELADKSVVIEELEEELRVSSLEEEYDC